MNSMHSASLDSTTALAWLVGTAILVAGGAGGAALILD